MWGILIPLLIGIAIGYFTPGKTDKSRLYLRALLWAVVIAAVIVLVGWLTDTSPILLGDASFFGLVISFAISLAILVLGVWIGDLIEAKTKGDRHERRGAL